jgi:hypothetical protein
MRELGSIFEKGRPATPQDPGTPDYTCVIREDDEGRVFFTSDADIDADGANGQHGGPAAYRTGDLGSDYLDNAAMMIVDGKVVCKTDDARDIVILDSDNEPKVFPGGIIASKTWYKYSDKAENDPAAYVDAETVAYIVVPPLIVHETVGVVRGCKARVTYGNRVVDCVVVDQGPTAKTGELSIAAARALGIPSSPRNGGNEVRDVLYELWPGVAAPGFELQPA